MNVHVRRIENGAVLQLRGALKLGQGEQDFRQAVQELFEEGIKSFAINLSHVPEMDSSGIGALVRVHTSARREGGKVRYFGATKKVQQSLKMVRLDTVLALFDNEESALADF